VRKLDEIEKIENLINSLCEKNYSIDKNIPRYLYHFTDVENLISIIKDSFIYSREYAIENNLMKNDNASSEVIDKTSDANKNYVRLYFRPKTPTQFHNEGIKSKGRNYPFDAHCPIPVFLLFNSQELLSDKRTRFVEKNLALNPPIKKAIEDLLLFDFEKIYHNGAFSLGDRDIIEKRHAEVLIEEKCDLKSLKYIVCRSLAEKELLVSLLKSEGIDENSFNIEVDNRNLLFNKLKSFIDYVELEIDYIKVGFVNFNYLTEDDEIIFAMKNLLTGETKEVKIEVSQCSSPSIFKISGDKEAYEFSILVNRKLIYFGVFEKQEDLPF